MDYKQKFIKSFLAASRRTKKVKALLNPNSWTDTKDGLLAALETSYKYSGHNPPLQRSILKRVNRLKLMRPANLPPHQPELVLGPREHYTSSSYLRPPMPPSASSKRPKRK